MRVPGLCLQECMYVRRWNFRGSGWAGDRPSGEGKKPYGGVSSGGASKTGSVPYVLLFAVLGAARTCGF